MALAKSFRSPKRWHFSSPNQLGKQKLWRGQGEPRNRGLGVGVEDCAKTSQNPGYIINLLCHLEQVTHPLWPQFPHL